MTDPPPPAEPSPPDGATRRAARRDAQLDVMRGRRDERLRTRLARANFASGIYGQILLLSVLVVLTLEPVSAERALATLLSSQLVFWLAHAYAQTLGAGVDASAHARTAQLTGAPAEPDGADREPRRLGHHLAHEWPIVEAAAPAVLLMVLALLGAIEVGTGLDIAIGFGVASLFVWGFAAARRRRRTLASQLLAAGASGALGLAIVVLKLLIH